MPNFSSLQNTICDIICQNGYFCIFRARFVTLSAETFVEEVMKKLLIGMALGAAAGMIIGEIPQVQKMINKGKKKVKEMTK